MEEWKPAPYSGYEHYLFSNMGNFKNIKPGKFAIKKRNVNLKPVIGKEGFLYATLSSEVVGLLQISLHVTVAKLFVANPENKQFVIFKDGDHQNCAADNLAWATMEEQVLHIQTVQNAKLASFYEDLDACYKWLAAKYDITVEQAKLYIKRRKAFVAAKNLHE